jgi:hypothetical protein
MKEKLLNATFGKSSNLQSIETRLEYNPIIIKKK